jgi:hypothetical protein
LLYTGYAGNLLLKDAFNTHFECHGRHGAGAASTGKFDTDYTIFRYIDQFNVTTVSLKGRTYEVEGFFYSFTHLLPPFFESLRMSDNFYYYTAIGRTNDRKISRKGYELLLQLKPADR